MKTSKHNQPIRNRLIAVLGLCLGLAATTTPLMAADITWDGGGDGSSWSASPANWVGDVAPVFNDRLLFDGSTGLAPNNDFPAGTNFNGIVFNSGAGAFTLSGNPLRLGGNITNNSANEQIISLNITNTAQRIYNAATANIVFTGSVNSFTLQKEGPYAVILGGSIGAGGLGAIVNNGTLVANKTTGSSLGGGVTINTNGTLRLAGPATDQIHFNQRITLNGGVLQIQQTNASGVGQFEEIGALSGSNNVASVIENGLAGTTNRLDIGGGSGHEGIYGGMIRDGAGVLNIQVYRHDNKYVFNGTNTYTGTTVIDNGTGALITRLILNGIHTGGGAYIVKSSAAANGAALCGSGIISASGVVISNNAYLSPGGRISVDLSDSATFTETAAILTISNAVTLWSSTATLDAQLNGTTAGSTHDQVVIAGGGVLTNNGGNLKLALGYTPAIGDKFTLVQVQGTDSNNNFGTFSNLNGVVTDLSQGATFVEPGTGKNIRISYRAEGTTFDMGAGLGNDIMLQVVAPVGGQNLTWRGNGINNNWDITTTADWFNGTSLVTFTNGDFVTFDDTGSNNIPLNLVGELTPSTMLVKATKNYVLGGTGFFTNTVVLTKTNTGKLSIVTDNVNIGSTIIQLGTVEIGTNGTTGTISGSVTVNANGTLAHNRSDNVELSQTFSGTGTFLNTGDGELIITNNIPFSGRTTNSGGMLQLGSGSGSSGSIAGDVNVSGTKVLRYYYAGDVSIQNTKSGNGTVIYEAASGNRTFTIPTTLVSSNFSGSNVLTAGVRLHAADFNNGYAFGNGGSIFVPDLAQAWCDRSATTYNQEFYIAGTGFTAVTPQTGAISIFGCTISGPVHLVADARIGGTINGGTISGQIDGAFQLEVLGNVNSFILSLGPTNGANTYGSTLVTSGSIRATTAGGISPGALTVDLNGQAEVFGNNVTVASLSNGGAGAGSILNNSSSAAGTLTVGTDGTSTTFDGTFANGSSRPLGLTKVGAGTLTLSAVNASTGPVAVNGGTLALTGLGAFGSASNISVAAGATLDVSARTDGTLTLNSGQTLSGSGTVTGIVISAASSTVSPGASVGTLTVSGDVTLGGTLYLELNKTNGQTSDKLVSSGGTITYGGALSVKNIGPALQVGDTFQLFTNAVTGFGSIVLSPTDDSGAVYTWTNKVAIDGSIQVIGVTERIYAVTIANQLISFGSTAPGTVLSGVSLTGLQAGEAIVGIDFQNNTLYALGSSSRLYTINRATGAATAVGGQFSPILNGTVYGMEAGPAGVRVVTDLKQNLLLDTTTGAATDLATLNGTPDPTISGLAYHPGTGQHYAADYVQNSIGTLNPATGFVTNIGTTTIDFSRQNGFDISAGTANTAYIATPASSSGDAANLYTINLGTGLESLVGLIGNIGDNYLIRGLAVGPDFSTAPAINPNPTNITFTASGGNLNLSWPASHLGWILQSQVNLRSVGLKTNWVDIAGSGLVTATNIPINKTDPTVFFRLRKP